MKSKTQMRQSVNKAKKKKKVLLQNTLPIQKFGVSKMFKKN